MFKPVLLPCLIVKMDTATHVQTRDPPHVALEAVTTRKLLFSFRPFLMLILSVSVHLASTNSDANAFFF